MNPTRPSGLYGAAGTFILLLTAVGFWFAAAGFAAYTPSTGSTLSAIAAASTLAAVVLFGLTVRSAILGGSSPQRRRRRSAR
jgi:hypothetical protein